LSNLETKSSSVDISISSINTFTSSNAIASLNSKTGSYATTGSNSFFGTQVFSGSVFIANDLVVQGSSSIQYISASSVSIGTNIVQLNTANPSVRFAGLAVQDSGSIGGSGSFLYDSVHDEFVFVHRGNGTNVTSSHFVLGPETFDNLGNETYLTCNRLPKGTGKEHLVDSCIYHDNNTTCIYNGALVINSNCQFIFGTTPADFTFNVGTTCVGTNATVAQFYNNDYTAGTRGFIRVRNNVSIGSTTSAYFGQGQDQKTYIYNNNPSRTGDIVITNTGKVGIGTASPIAQLHIKTDVASASRPTTLATSATNSAAYITTICGSTAGIAFGQLGSNTSYIQTTYEDGSACTPLALNPYQGGVGISTGNNEFSGQKLFIQSNNDQAGITMYNSYDCNMWALATGTAGINNKGFAIRDEINGVTRLQIDNCGRIGIGTLSPTVELSVKPGTDNASIRVGTWAIMENVTTNQTMFGYNAAYATSLGSGWRYINNGYAMGIRMHDAYGSGDIMFHLSCCGTGGTNIGSTWDGTDLKMIIKNNGNVGINNMAPLAALEINQACSDQNNGGFVFKTMSLADNTWTTFFTPPANWAGFTFFNWVGTNDFNRSGAAQIRWSYQSCAAQLGPTTTIFNTDQNAAGYFRYSGGNMQICIDGAGAGKRLQVMIMGSRGA
jgi:hypothetical protein